MIMIFRLALLTPIIFFILTGCAYLPGYTHIQNRDKQYLSAKNEPPLRIPPGLNSQTIQNHYPIADRNYSTRSKDISQIPPGLYSP